MIEECDSLGNNFRLPLENYGEFGTVKKLCLLQRLQCAYSYLNLQKLYLTCRERRTIQTCHLLGVHDSPFQKLMHYQTFRHKNSLGAVNSKRIINDQNIIANLVLWREKIQGYSVKRHIQQYFSYIVAVSFLSQVTDKLYHIKSTQIHQFL